MLLVVLLCLPSAEMLLMGNPDDAGIAADATTAMGTNPDSDMRTTGTRVDPNYNLNFDGEIDLAHDAQVTFYGKNGGSSGGDQAGFAVATGDIDDDGRTDLVIGAPNAPFNQSHSPPEFGSGEIYVYFGRDRADFAGSIDIGKDVPNITMRCGGSESGFGTSIVVADLNNDSYDDIVIGAPAGYGAIYVLLGRERSFFKSVYDNEADSTFSGDKYHIGTLISCGDVDNDGCDDIAYSTYQGFSTPDCKLGLIWGSPSMPKYLSSVASIPSKNQSYGSISSLSINDINDDGYDDILIGCPNYFGQDPARLRVGRLFVILGRPRAEFHPTPYFEDYANLTVYGKEDTDSFGTNSAIGDINGDGYNDFFMSAPYSMGWNNSKKNSGEAYVFRGNSYISFGLGKWGDPQNTPKVLNISDIPHFEIYGASEEDRMGYSAYLADLDKDGFEDLQLCAPGGDGPDEGRKDCGETYLLFGTNKGFPSYINATTKDMDLVIYGGGLSDMVGSAITSGDMDNDTFTDIVVSSNYAAGPGNKRKNCGEVYIIFAAGIRTKGFGLKGGYDPVTETEGAGNICFSNHTYYEFYVTLSDSKGLSDLDSMDITLDPEGASLAYRWDRGTGAFSEMSDPTGCCEVDPVSSSVAVSGMNITVGYELRFGWNYPTEALQGAKILMTNTTGVKVQSRYYNIFKVESDLDIFGDLRVTSSVCGDVSVNGSWCARGGYVNWSGPRVVYQGTDSIYPPDADFDIAVKGNGGAWYENISSGTDMQITTPPPSPTTNEWGVRYDVDIVSLRPGASDASDLWHYLRVDEAGPPAPTGLEVRPDDLADPPASIDNDNAAYVDWTRVNDVTKGSGNRDGVGVKCYHTSTVGGPDVSNGSVNWVPGGLTGYYYDTGNFYGLTFTRTDPTIFFDWGPWSPDDMRLKNDNFSVRWTGKIYFNETTAYSLYIHGDDGAKVWIDDELIYDQWHPAHPLQVIKFYQKGLHDIRIEYRDLGGDAAMLLEWEYGFMTRTPVPASNLYHCPEWTYAENLSEGNNTVHVWAEDMLGNIGPASAINVTVDTTGPYYKDPIMPDKWSRITSHYIGITVADNISGVSDDIQYSISTAGPASFGDWEKVASGIITNIDNSTLARSFAVNKPFTEGSQNYVRFRAKDVLGNGYTVSARYNIRIDTTLPVVGVDLPQNDSYVLTNMANFTAVLTDLGGSGIDISSIQYRYSSNGTNDYSPWTSVPALNLSILSQGRFVYANLSIWIPEGDNNWFQVRAKDVAGNGYSTSAPVHFVIKLPIVNRPPIPVISYPTQGQTFYWGDPILLDASNTTDDGHMRPLKFTWYSDWEGYIGFGERTTPLMPLRIRAHNITLRVWDGEYNISAKVMIMILRPENPAGPVNPVVLDPANDTDADGIWDLWEVEHFGDLNASDGKGDTDKDGYSDYLEYLYDSDPKDKNDKPPAYINPDLPQKDNGPGLSIYLIIASLIVLLALIAGAFVYMYLRKKEKRHDEVGGDNLMTVGGVKGKSEIYDRPVEEFARPYIKKKSKAELDEAAKKLYGEHYVSKKGKKKGKNKGTSGKKGKGSGKEPGSGTKKKDGPEDMTRSPQFGEAEFDEKSFDEAFGDEEKEDNEFLEEEEDITGPGEEFGEPDEFVDSPEEEDIGEDLTELEDDDK